MNPDHLTHLYCSTSSATTTPNTITRAQLAHRIHIVQIIWKIPEGARVLEIGPGQGDCTLVLAAAVGEASSVIGVDPCAREYGSPTTVAQSQSHLLTTPLGQRITFIRATPLAPLRSQPPSTYTHIVFLHCLWYFDSSGDISALLSALVASPEQSEQGLRPRPKILIAEWALQVSLPEQVPHLLAALTRNMLQSHNPDSEANIRTAVSPDFIKSTIEQPSSSPLASPLQPRYTLLHEETITPEPDLLDGQWEVSSVLNEEFEREVERIFEGDERAVAAVRAVRDALAYAAVQNHEDLLHGVSKALSEVADALPRTKVSTILYPTEDMKQMVSILYAHIIRFFIRAMDWYEEGRLKHAVNSIMRPYALYFKDIVQDIRECAARVYGLAVTSAQAVLRKMYEQLLEMKEMMRSMLLISKISSFAYQKPAHQSINSRALIDINQRVCDLQFTQILTFTASTPLPEPEKSLQYCCYIRRRRRLRHIPEDRFIWQSPKLQTRGSSVISSLVIVKGPFATRNHRPSQNNRNSRDLDAEDSQDREI